MRRPAWPRRGRREAVGRRVDLPWLVGHLRSVEGAKPVGLREPFSGAAVAAAEKRPPRAGPAGQSPDRHEGRPELVLHLGRVEHVPELVHEVLVRPVRALAGVNLHVWQRPLRPIGAADGARSGAAGERRGRERELHLAG
jgi:hypothetical protein